MAENKQIRILLIVVISLLTILIFSSIISDNWNLLSKWLYPEDSDKNAKSLQLIFSIIGGLVIILGLYISYKRVTSLEKSVKIQQEALLGQNRIIENQTTEIELSRKSHINEQFKIAVEHLGNENKSVVIGGFVELVFIAEEDPKKYAEIVHKLFCSYLRSEASLRKKEEDIDFYLIENIINFLFNSSTLRSKRSDLSNLNFRECSFEDLNFENVNFSGCYMPLKLENCFFENCRFDKTKFVNSKIKIRFITAFQKEVDETKKAGILSNVQFSNCGGKLLYFYFYELKDLKFSNCGELQRFQFVRCFLHKIKGEIFHTSTKHFFSEFISVDMPKDVKDLNLYCCDFQNMDFSDTVAESWEVAYCKFTYSKIGNFIFSRSRIMQPRFDPKRYYRICYVPSKEFLEIHPEFDIKTHPFYNNFEGRIVVGRSNPQYVSQVDEKLLDSIKEFDIKEELV